MVAVIIGFYNDMMIELEAQLKRVKKLFQTKEVEYQTLILAGISKLHSMFAKFKTDKNIKTVHQNKIRNHLWKKKSSIAPLMPELNMLLIVVICF